MNLPHTKKIFRINVNSFFQRYDQKFIRFTTGCIIFFCAILLIVSLIIPETTHHIFGFHTAGDYPVFYVAGKILNTDSHHQLYDLDLQFKILQSLIPGHDGALPNPYPPFFNLLFQPLALLPFLPSYISWLMISICLYVSGLILLRKSCPNISQDDFTTGVLLAISFEPFIIETCIGGQASACGFFILSLAVFLEKRKKPLLSGFVLGFALYKPTLLVIILPFLLATKRFRNLIGFLACAVLLATISFAMVGPKVCLDWFHLQIGYTRATAGISDFFRQFKYVDFLSFFRLLYGNMHNLAKMTAFITTGSAFIYLVVFSAKARKVCNDVLWAGAFSSTLIVNCYVPLYDTIIIVIGLFLTKNWLIENGPVLDDSTDMKFNILLVLTYVTPWFTQNISRYTGLQVFTLTIAAVGGYQYLLIHRFLRQKR